jgi:hypothetical protein
VRGTFTIPPQRGWGIDDAHRVRVGSERRYIVLTWAHERWQIEYRSDDRQRASQRAMHVGCRVLDTHTGEVW